VQSVGISKDVLANCSKLYTGLPFIVLLTTAYILPVVQATDSYVPSVVHKTHPAIFSAR